VSRFLRLALVIVIGLFELGSIVATLATFDQSVGEYGYNIGPDGTTVIAVEPGLPASRAGIVAGDRISYEQLPLPGRLNVILNWTVPAASPLSIELRHGSTVRIVHLTAAPLPRLYGAADLSFAFAGFCLGAVSLALVLMRPNRMTWGFALVVPPLVLPEAVFLWMQHAPVVQGFSCAISFALLYGLQAFGTISFASRFPANEPAGIARWIDRVAVPVGLAAAAIYIATDYTIWFGSAPPPRWLLASEDYLAPIVPNALALIAIVATYARSDRNLRSRLAPALTALVLMIVTAMAQQFGEVGTSNATILLATYFAFAASAALLAASVAYGVVRHRVIDVNFFIGRTLVYGTLTIVAVSVFSLIEYLFGKLLERGGLATVLEILSAIALGLSLNALHGRLDHFIDVVLFRRRHVAEARVARTAHNVAFANSTDIVEEMLVNEPADAFGLASAAVFAEDPSDASFVRRRTLGWDDGSAVTLDGDDHLVVRMRAELQAGELSDLRWPRHDVPGGASQPIYAIPIVVGRHLHAIALYGAHSSGEDIDPDERAGLRQLAAGAALAYDHLATKALRDRIAALQNENAALRRSEETLSAIVVERLPRSIEPDGA
jgi:hypothetical protein